MLWTACTEGHAHWGPRGAAGLLLARDGAALLQLRPRWAHRGGTWSIPGGALEHDETAVDTALREALEELGIDRRTVTVGDSFVTSCGGWTYETVLATPSADLTSRDRDESAGHRWVPLDDVAGMKLHPGFRAAWEHPDRTLRTFVETS